MIREQAMFRAAGGELHSAGLADGGGALSAAAKETLHIALNEARRVLTILQREEMALRDGRLYVTVRRPSGSVLLSEIVAERLRAIHSERAALEKRVSHLAVQAGGSGRLID